MGGNKDCVPRETAHSAIAGLQKDSLEAEWEKVTSGKTCFLPASLADLGEFLKQSDLQCSYS